jgi:hypothetical protein
MKIIITEDQQKLLKNQLCQIINKFGVKKAVNEFSNLNESNQHFFYRRYSEIVNEIYNVLDGSDPCYYDMYESFNAYKRDVVINAIKDVIYLNGSNISLSVDETIQLKNKLLEDFGDMITDYYEKFISEKCPNQN